MKSYSVSRSHHWRIFCLSHLSYVIWGFSYWKRLPKQLSELGNVCKLHPRKTFDAFTHPCNNFKTKDLVINSRHNFSKIILEKRFRRLYMGSFQFNSELTAPLFPIINKHTCYLLQLKFIFDVCSDVCEWQYCSRQCNDDTGEDEAKISLKGGISHLFHHDLNRLQSNYDKMNRPVVHFPPCPSPMSHNAPL